MRKAIALDESTGSTNRQDDEPCSYHETLGCHRGDYERQDVAKPKPVPMAQVSWADARPTAERLKDASDLAFIMEARRRGYEIADRVLSGKYYDSGKKKHRKKHKQNKSK